MILALLGFAMSVTAIITPGDQWWLSFPGGFLIGAALGDSLYDLYKRTRQGRNKE